MSTTRPVRPSNFETGFSRDECLTRLAFGDIGRIVFPSQGGLDVHPVNYATGAGDSVIIRSATGAKLTFAQREPHAVAFETDGTDGGGTVWWVTMVGRLTPVLDLTKLPALARLEITPWADAVERPHFLRLEPSKVSGGMARIRQGRIPHSPRAEATSDATGPVASVNDRGGLEVLPTDECMQLLAAAPMGRLAFMVAGLPSVVPAVQVTAGSSGHIVVSARADLAPLTPTQAVTFQVDSFDAADRTGWSVLVRGTVERVTEAAGEELHTDPDRSARSADQWVRVRPVTITGRRIRPRD